MNHDEGHPQTPPDAGAELEVQAPAGAKVTFSSSVEGRARHALTTSAEKPTDRIEIGIADSMPWPSLSAM